MPRIQKILFGASVAMFLISVAHLALVIQQAASAKPIKANAQARIVLSVFQFVIGDLILIWRVWVIWGRNYLIAAPPFAIMVVAAGLTFNVATLHEFRSFFTVAPSALIVANTSICTLLIAGRIWHSRYQLRLLSKNAVLTSGFSGTVALFIESGALYAAIQIISLALDHAKNDGIHIVLDLEMPLIGILPTLIIVFVHFGLVDSAARKLQNSAANSTMRFQQKDRVNLDTFVSSMATNTGMGSDNKGHHYSQHDSSMA
ncbi:hypothetical protein DXG01_017078 [Tephrocybe rancida]|nr:hypothetical protein DXG01_017078 [Tephrocybe rancida]